MNESDFEYFKEKIKNIILEKKKKLNIFENIENIEIYKIGENQKDLNFKIIINYKIKFIFKFSTNENLKELKYEYEILELLFEEIGPYPVFFDDSKKILELNYMVQTFVSGKHLQRWFERHLIILARKIAQLHRIKLNFMIDSSSKKKKKLNIWDHFVEINEKYFDGIPEMMSDIDIKELLANFQKYLINNQHYFDSLKEFSLIHGNLKPNNIIFNETEVFFINWNKAKYFDNARDLATFFYDDFFLGDERVKLTSERKELFIDNYLRAYWMDPTFKERLNIWITFDMFCSLVIFKSKYYYNLKEYNNLNNRELLEKIENLIHSLHKNIPK